MTLHPDDLDDAVTRATKAANRAGVLPYRWAAVAVEYSDRRYAVVLGLPGCRMAACYRVRPDLRLRRITRWPWPVLVLARELLGTIPLLEVERPGLREGWIMTQARLERVRWRPR